MPEKFCGFKPEAYIFLKELGFNNNKQWMDENRWRYKEYVYKPLCRLGEMLLPTMLDIDSEFNPRLTTIVSRINRDTRYSKNKLPYRDHMWLGFRRDGRSMGESLCMYFEISPTGYGYGSGMYCTNLEVMNGLRAHAMADPEGFRRVINAPALKRYTVEGESYKKDKVPAAPEDIKPYLNLKGMSLCYESHSLAPTMNAGIFDEVKTAMEELAPFYRYVCNVK